VSSIVPFVQPRRDLPAWIATYDPYQHRAAITLRDLAFLAERINAEHTATSCWATTAGGKLGLMLCGRGARCKHKIEVGEQDSFVAILLRVDQVVNEEHIDVCLKRAKGRKQQATLAFS
jgi:hypothetical protein